MTPEAWIGLACLAVGGVLAWTAVIIAVFGLGWWHLPPRRRVWEPCPRWAGEDTLPSTMPQQAEPTWAVPR